MDLQSLAPARIKATSSVQRRNRLGAKLLLLVGSLASTFAIAELGMRVLGIKPRSATVLTTYFQWDAQSGWRGRSLAQCRFTTSDFDAWISHGPDGFRRCEFEATPATDRDSNNEVVWCVGDSMTWGWGVDDGTTFVDFLNRHSDGTRYRNLGHPGFSSIQEYLLLKDLFAAGPRPDRVLLLFCSNDLRENLDAWDQSPPRPYLRVVGGDAEIVNLPTPQPHIGSGLAWLKNHSLVCNHVNYLAMRAKQNWRSAKHAQRTAMPIAAEASGPQEPAPPVDCPPEQQLGLEYAYGLIRDLCHEHQVEFLVASEFEVHPVLRDTCGKLGIRLLDLSVSYSRYAHSLDAAQPWHFASDPHFTEFGHRLVARGMREQLEALSTPAVATGQPAGTPSTRRF